MNYIKYFKETNNENINIFNQEDLDIIKDIFQDLIDEYSLEKVDLYDQPFQQSYMIIFHEYISPNKEHDEFSEDTNCIKIRIYINKEFLKKLKIDWNNFIKRLENLGYGTQQYTTSLSRTKYLCEVEIDKSLPGI